MSQLLDSIKQTVRRKRATKVGEKLQLYTGMRTKNCQLIMWSKCISILPVQVLRGLGVYLDGKLLSKEETIAFAIADGFEDVWAFFDFFDQYPYEVLANELELITWGNKNYVLFDDPFVNTDGGV